MRPKITVPPLRPLTRIERAVDAAMALPPLRAAARLKVLRASAKTLRDRGVIDSAGESLLMNEMARRAAERERGQLRKIGSKAGKRSRRRRREA